MENSTLITCLNQNYPDVHVAFKLAHHQFELLAMEHFDHEHKAALALSLAQNSPRGQTYTND